MTIRKVRDKYYNGGRSLIESVTQALTGAPPPEYGRCISNGRRNPT
jgi:hypothetical protein